LYNAHETRVIDFKFTADQTAAPQHQLQVAQYVQLYQAMGFAQVMGYVVYGQQLLVAPVT